MKHRIDEIHIIKEAFSIVKSIKFTFGERNFLKGDSINHSFSFLNFVDHTRKQHFSVSLKQNVTHF